MSKLNKIAFASFISAALLFGFQCNLLSLFGGGGAPSIPPIGGGAALVCGDGVCSQGAGANESSASCAADCGVYSVTDDTTVYAGSGYLATYTFACTMGLQYTAMWNDSWMGDGAFTGDVRVSVQDSNLTYMVGAAPPGGGIDSGYYGNTPNTFTPAAGGTCTIYVESFSGATTAGTFGLWITQP